MEVAGLQVEDPVGGLQLDAMDVRREGLRAEVEIPIPGLRLATAALVLAGEVATQGMFVEADDAWYETGAGGKPRVGENFRGLGHGDDPLDRHGPQVDDRQDAILRLAGSMAWFDVVVVFDHVGAFAHQREVGIVRTFDLRGADLDHPGHHLVAGLLGVPAVFQDGSREGNGGRQRHQGR